MTPLILYSRALMLHTDRVALPMAMKAIIPRGWTRCKGVHSVSMLRDRSCVNLLDLLDPDTVVGDVQIVEYVGRVILSEDLVNIKQAFEDAGSP